MKIAIPRAHDVRGFRDAPFNYVPARARAERQAAESAEGVTWCQAEPKAASEPKAANAGATDMASGTRTRAEPHSAAGRLRTRHGLRGLELRRRAFFDPLSLATIQTPR